MDIFDKNSATSIGSNMNIRKLLELKARQHADKPFIIFVDKNNNEEVLTYRQFDIMVNQFANWLISQGIKKDDFVFTHLANSIGFLVVMHACTKIGAIMIPSIIFDVADDLEYKLNFSEAKLIVTDEEYYDMFDSILEKCPSVKEVVIYRSTKKLPGTHNWEDILSQSSPELRPIEIDPLDTALMLFTSGTTARPKGVVLTHGGFLNMGEVCSKSFAVGPDDRYLLVLPLFHVNAQCISYFACLTAGASIVVCEQFSASRFGPLIRQYGCTISSLVSATVKMILAQPEHPLDSENKMWRCPYAIAISDEEWDAFEKRFNTTLIDLYGLTETYAPCTIMPIWGEHRRGSVGWPNPGTKINIVDHRRVPVPVGEVGEIVIKGERGIVLFKEYYKNPEATNQDFDGNWFFSGDYGKLDEEGYVYFVDRKKDVIKRAGENIAAAEVERVIGEYPGIEEVSVIGVPDPIRDEAVMAIVRPFPGENISQEGLKSFCREKMAKFKVPAYYIFQKKEFPKTSIGKIRKNIIREDVLKDWNPS
jgi:crotonobetaine/carnitine-CoA ligase